MTPRLLTCGEGETVELSMVIEKLSVLDSVDLELKHLLFLFLQFPGVGFIFHSNIFASKHQLWEHISPS